jgi:predicted SAM-dependent methyltransferase
MEIKLNLGAGQKQLRGFVNLDKNNGWYFQQGLNYQNDSISAITISHALLCITKDEMISVLAEAKRVMEKDAVMRITEDDTENPMSDTFGIGWKCQAKVLTGPIMMRKCLEDLGFKVLDVNENSTYYKDRSLMQNFHGGRPRCFFIEAIKL